VLKAGTPIPGRFINIPFLSYTDAWALQQTLAQERQNDQCFDTLLLIEHEPVLTLGRTTKAEHWEPHWAELETQGIHLHHTNRGGSATYHGPGQVIGYPILQLRNFCPGPKVYVQKLEEVLIRTLAEWEISGCRHELFRGVWIDPGKGHLEKIASIGVRISRGITMHGFALNMNVDLQPFSFLTPCGIENCVMTSMEKIVGNLVDSNLVRDTIAGNFAKEFGIQWADDPDWSPSPHFSH